jgi:AraC-like DNA-binding protein
MAGIHDPDEKVPPASAPRPRLDDPDPSWDPRFRFHVSVPPVRYLASTGSGWNGVLLAEGDAGFVRSGEVRNDHEVLFLQRWETPNVARPVDRRGRWTTLPPGVKLYLPGDREYGEWRGRPWAQMLFVTPERAEAVLGTPWDRSGLTRWRDERHPLPFVDHVVSALMHDLEAGHPAGPITGDALVASLLLHLDAGRSAASAARRGALGRRLAAVRDYVEDNLARAIRLDELAALAGVDVRRFGAIFTAETGSPPEQYVLLRRIARAKALLREPELTLAQVARAVGFTDAVQLARVFRLHAGEDPGAHRRH